MPIGYGQTISQPYIVGAFMTQALKPEAHDRVLEKSGLDPDIGSGAECAGERGIHDRDCRAAGRAGARGADGSGLPER